MEELSRQFDGPTAAFKRQNENDEAARATPERVREFLLAISEKLEPAIGAPGVAILRLLGAKAEVDVEAFVDCVVSEFGLVHKNIAEVQKSQRALEIFLHGAEEARRSSDHEKTKRLAKIVTTGILSPNEPDQKISEFIRIAGILIDVDILVLNAIYQTQHELLKRNLEWVQRFTTDPTQDHNQNALANRENNWTIEVYEAWKQLRGVPRGDGKFLTRTDIRSAIVRLESVGLVSDIPGSGAEGPIFGRPCGLLELGCEFVEYLQLKLKG